MTESEKQRILKANMALGMDLEEAKRVLAEDLAIDRGERLDWEPSVEEEREMRKATKIKVERKPRAKGERKKEENPVKRDIMARLAEAFQSYDGFAITNPEKSIDFTVDGVKFTLSLTQHREKKA